MRDKSHRWLVFHEGEWVEVDPDQLWFWSPEWQAGEREVDEQIKRGEVKHFDTIEELFEDLNSCNPD